LKDSPKTPRHSNLAFIVANIPTGDAISVGSETSAVVIGRVIVISPGVIISMSMTTTFAIV
jgi:hypothetical protein